MASNITTFTVATVSHAYAGTVAVSAVATISFHCSGHPCPGAKGERAIAERWITSARRECLDRMLITSERHLQLVLSLPIAYC